MLNLQTAPHPFFPQKSLAMFRDWESAFVHIRDHLLSEPECHMWLLVAPDFTGILDFEDGKVRLSYSIAAKDSQGESCQNLYELYCRAVERDMAAAKNLQWHCSKDGLTVGFGNHGVYFLLNQSTVLTAHLPGFGSAAGTRAGQQSDKLDPRLPRQHNTGRLRHNKPIARAVKHEQKWNGRERLYYWVFRPCLNWLKEQQPNPEKEPFEQAYLWLKKHLPRRSQMHFDAWQETL